MDGAEGHLHHVSTRGSGNMNLPLKPPWCPAALEKMQLVTNESKDPPSVTHKNAQTTM